MSESITSNEELSTYRDFWRKHALGPLERPSCLVCGRVPTEWPPGIQHGELPGIVVCTRCRDAGQRAAHETKSFNKWPGEPPHCMSCSCGMTEEQKAEAAKTVPLADYLRVHNELMELKYPGSVPSVKADGGA